MMASVFCKCPILKIIIEVNIELCQLKNCYESPLRCKIARKNLCLFIYTLSFARKVVTRGLECFKKFYLYGKIHFDYYSK